MENEIDNEAGQEPDLQNIWHNGYFSSMKKYLVIPALLIFVACNAGTDEHTTTEIATGRQDTLANAVFEEAAKEEQTLATPDTFCYIMMEGDENKNINAVKIIVDGNKIDGELKYIQFGQKPAAGQLSGTIKDNIITADWSFVRDTGYYRVPVAFKRTKDALLQKPTAVNEQGQPYVPEDGEYSFEFKSVDCKYYPQNSSSNNGAPIKFNAY